MLGGGTQGKEGRLNEAAHDGSIVQRLNPSGEINRSLLIA
jgi:hypothetical protein